MKRIRFFDVMMFFLSFYSFIKPMERTDSLLKVYEAGPVFQEFLSIMQPYKRDLLGIIKQRDYSKCKKLLANSDRIDDSKYRYCL